MDAHFKKVVITRTKYSVFSPVKMSVFSTFVRENWDKDHHSELQPIVEKLCEFAKLHAIPEALLLEVVKGPRGDFNERRVWGVQVFNGQYSYGELYNYLLEHDMMF